MSQPITQDYQEFMELLKSPGYIQQQLEAHYSDVLRSAKSMCDYLILIEKDKRDDAIRKLMADAAETTIKHIDSDIEKLDANSYSN